MSKITVGVAGHFNPLHSGHLKMFEEAKSHGDRLIVIVANDIQASKKRGSYFMPLEERVKILEALKIVDMVIVSEDTDSDVCKTLRNYRLAIDIFASGCDKDHPDALIEKKTCDELGIKALYGIGGVKINSSSDILKNHESVIYKKKRVEGLEFFTPEYFPLQIGMHEPKEDRVSKLHKHNEITEFLYVEDGEIEITTTDNDFNNPKISILKKGDSILLFRGGHSVKLYKGCRVLEVKNGFANDKTYAN